MAEKVTKIEKFRRIKTVSTWILKGYSHADIIQNISENWGIDERQAYNYIKESFEIFKEDTLLELADAKAFHLKARFESYKELIAERDKVQKDKKLDAYKRVQMMAMISNQINALLRDMAKIEGLFVSKVEHTGKNGGAIKHELYELTDEQIEEELKRLTIKAGLIDEGKVEKEG